MNGASGDITAAGEPGRVRSIAEARVRAELALAEALFPGADAVPCAGDPFARVMLVKGHRGPAEDAGGEALSGLDGTAAAKALGALGFDPESVFRALSRPVGEADETALAGRLRWLVEAVDPEVVVAVDSVGAQDCSLALGIRCPAPGRPVDVRGRRLLFVDGLEASLADPERKRRVWSQLKSLAT